MVCLLPTRPLPDFAGAATPAKSVLCRMQRPKMHKTSLLGGWSMKLALHQILWAGTLWIRPCGSDPLATNDAFKSHLGISRSTVQRATSKPLRLS